MAIALSLADPSARAAVLTPPPPVPAASEIDQSSDNLSLKQTLDQQYQDVLQLYQATEPGAENYITQYANKTVEKGSPDEAAGLAAYQQIKPGVDSYKDALASYRTALAQLRPKTSTPTPNIAARVNLYVDPGSLLIRNEPKYDLAKIQAEIDGIRNALVQLNSVKEMNDAQLEEWQKASEKASNDAWELGANLTVDLLTENLKNRGESIDKQIEQANEALKGETDPAKLKSIQEGITDLASHKAQLEKATEAVEAAKDGVDTLGKLAADGDETKDPKELQSRSQKVSEDLEKAWEIASQAGVLPPGAEQAKGMTDAAYLVAVQCVSVGQVNRANANADQYLKAVTSLSKKMEGLVDLKKAAGAAH
jgi:hypothetical protein